MDRPSWLVSYPRSGTTWMRFLIAHLTGPPAETSADLTRRVPSIHYAHEGWTDRLDQDGWLASHKSWPPHEERYGRDMPRLVHIVRHPADALLSAARYACLERATAIRNAGGCVDGNRLEEILRAYLHRVLEQGETPEHRRAGIGSWAEHTAGWMARHDAQPTHFLRYEDLIADPAATVRELAEFLGAPPEAVPEAARRYGPARMRSQQEDEIETRTRGIFYLGDEHAYAYQLGLRFVGRDRVGAGLQLGRGPAERLVSQFGDIMDKLGYTADPRAPVRSMPHAPVLVAS